MILVYCFFLHFVADFLLQSREMGKKKSQEFSWLIRHLEVQAAVFLIGLWPVLGFITAATISGANVLIHGIIDWFIWRGYKKIVLYRIDKYKLDVVEWKYWEDHWFYTTIGFDQLLHGVTLIVLIQTLTRG